MRVLIDAVGCGPGGISTYVANLLQAWTRELPDDEVHLLRSARDPRWTAPGVVEHELAIPAPDLVCRPIVQTRAARRLVRELAPDGVLTARPATPLLRLDVPLAVVVHDLRHELRRDQFPASRRAIRQLSYRRAYTVASGFVCISQRTQDDLFRLHPALRGKPSAVVHHGADHVAGWPHRPVPPYVLAFGHHSNKNVEMVLRAWAELVADGTVSAATPKLGVVGLAAQPHAEFTELAGRLGITEHLVLSRYLADDEFHALMVGCAAVLFPSDFEGFGLPVVEAMQLGKPVVVGPDEAVREIAQGHATMMSDFTAAALADGIRRALRQPRREVAAAREYAAEFTWARTVRQTRDFLLSLG